MNRIYYTTCKQTFLLFFHNFQFLVCWRINVVEIRIQKKLFVCIFILISFQGLSKVFWKFWSCGVVHEFTKMADSLKWMLDYFIWWTLKKVRKYQYFCRFELENMSIYEILPAFDLTQSVHAKISIGMHRWVKF
jgi:hypothetical protein